MKIKINRTVSGIFSDSCQTGVVWYLCFVFSMMRKIKYLIFYITKVAY